jgi:hypothetical protein
VSLIQSHEEVSVLVPAAFVIIGLLA